MSKGQGLAPGTAQRQGLGQGLGSEQMSMSEDGDDDDDDDNDVDDDNDEDDDDNDDDDNDHPHHPNLTPLLESIISRLAMIAEIFHTSAAAEALAEGRLKHANVVFCTLASAGYSQTVN